MNVSFKQWLNEDVNVQIEIPQDKRKRIAKTLMELSYLVLPCADRFFKWGSEQITPDGEDYDKTSGIMNIYVNQHSTHTEILPEQATRVIQKLKTCFESLGARVGKIYPNTHGDYQKTRTGGPWQVEKGLNPNKVRVYRMEISIDPQQIKAADMPPDVNMGFETARIVFEEIFGLPSAGNNPMGKVLATFAGENPEEDQGWNGYEFSAQHIIDVYSRMKNDLEMWAGMEQMPTSKSGGKGKSKFYNGGVSTELIIARVKEVVRLAQWAVNHGYTKMYAA